MLDDYGLLDLLPLLIAGFGVGRGWSFPMNNDEEELGGPSGDAYLLEDGSGYYLMEDGNYYLKE
jgi:hypothetical protein